MFDFKRIYQRIELINPLILFQSTATDTVTIRWQQLNRSRRKHLIHSQHLRSSWLRSATSNRWSRFKKWPCFQWSWSLETRVGQYIVKELGHFVISRLGQFINSRVGQCSISKSIAGEWISNELEDNESVEWQWKLRFIKRCSCSETSTSLVGDR